MPGDWDDSLKMFIGENAQDFVSWLFEGARVTGKLLTQFKKRTIDADALVEAIENRGRFLAHFEFQSTNDSSIAERLLEYNFEARRAHKLPVYSCVIYLKDNGDVPESPLIWTMPNGQEVLRFYYLSIELARIRTEELRSVVRVHHGLLPLLLLTKDGVTQEIVEEIIAGLDATKQHNLLPITELLASLVFKREADQEWLKGRFAMLKEILRNTPAYQDILQEGRQEAQQEKLQEQREALLTGLTGRFPDIASSVREPIEAIEDPSVLWDLIIKMITVQSADEAKQLILTVNKQQN